MNFASDADIVGRSFTGPHLAQPDGQRLRPKAIKDVNPGYEPVRIAIAARKSAGG